MRALTLIRPMSAAIVHGTKRIENRPMDLPRAMRGVTTVVAVHAGKKWSEEYGRAVQMIDDCGRDMPQVSYAGMLDDEGIVGLMRLTGRVFTTADAARCSHPYGEHSVLCSAGAKVGDDPWWSGPFGYDIDRVVAFAEPIACRGMQGFWPVPGDIRRKILIEHKDEWKSAGFLLGELHSPGEP